MNVIQAEKDLRPKWDEFMKSNATDGGILQSWAWGDFQKSLDKKIYRFAAVSDTGEIQAAALVIKNIINFDYAYFYIPRGPVLANFNTKAVTLIFEEIIKVAKEEKAFMLRCDPAWKLGNEKFLMDNGFRKSDKEVQPKCSLILDITKDEQTILAEMKQKTRYNINLASKKGVVIKSGKELSGVEQFWQLLKQTSKRDDIASHAKEYYKKMFEVLSTEGTLELIWAEYDNKIIVANMVSFFGTTATYLHGASADMYRGVMAPYLLQWESILMAKKLGCKYFDLGGLNGASYQNSKWEGITRFKSGFSTVVPSTEFVGTHEVILNPVVYSLYKFAKQIKG